MTIQDLLPYLTILGFILMFFGYLFTQFKFGGRGVAKEIIDNYKTRQDQLEADLRLTNEQVIKLQLQIATMNGQLIEKDKKIAELTTIFQGRDPELVSILKEIRDFMKKLSTQSTTNQDRNIKIDKDTKEEKGNVMRNK